tara:strand:- start:2803 stop:2946 length:144 start_codon:yes stop_codon:yes gene_type:complete
MQFAPFLMQLMAEWHLTSHEDNPPGKSTHDDKETVAGKMSLAFESMS